MIDVCMRIWVRVRCESTGLFASLIQNLVYQEGQREDFLCIMFQDSNQIILLYKLCNSTFSWLAEKKFIDLIEVDKVFSFHCWNNQVN